MTNPLIGDPAREPFHERYTVEQQLGKHAGRRTLLARDRQTQELVVIKLLSFSHDFAWDDLKLFEREAETLKTLAHPAIPRYLDYFELDSPEIKGFALVQTYIEGLSLEEQLKAGRTFSESEVRQIAKALLEILTYLHGRQPPVIHRDIKPSNVLLANRSANSVGQVYLVDFGSVQTLAANPGSNFTVVGTYGYMPPEQFGGRTVTASDLYGLGATLITLVTGTHPADLPQQELRIQFEQATHLTPAFVHWLRRMTEPSLERRFTSARKALQALEQQTEIASLVVRKPPGSQVSLTTTVDSLEILIPPLGFHGGMIFIGLFAIAWNSFLLMWTSMALLAPLPINLVFTLFSLPFWGAGIGMIMTILFPLFGRVRLRLNQQQISLTYELFGCKYNRPKPTQRQNIYRLDYTGRSFTKDAEGERVEIKPQLIIWADRQKYELGGNGLLSEPELDWLALELSTWLELPITKIRYC
jgi:serine/threonine protein kinase